MQGERSLLFAAILKLSLHLNSQRLGDTSQEHIQNARFEGVKGRISFLPFGGDTDYAVVCGGQGWHRQKVRQNLGLDIRQHSSYYRNNLKNWLMKEEDYL